MSQTNTPTQNPLPVESAETITKEENVQHLGSSARDVTNFASKCRTKFIHANEIETYDVSNNHETSGKFFIGAISSGNHQDEIYTTLENQVHIKFKLDTGSQVNIITNNVFKKPISILSKPNVKRTSYAGDSIPIAGKCVLPYKEQQLECYVTYAKQPSVLGYNIWCELELIKVTLAKEKIQTDFSPVDEYLNVFTRLGCLKQPYTIHIDSSEPPVVHNPRQITVAFREELKKTVDYMEDIEVIKKVDQPTDWVNSLVIAEKSKTGKLRICLDPRDLNKAIKREHFLCCFSLINLEICSSRFCLSFPWFMSILLSSLYEECI